MMKDFIKTTSETTLMNTHVLVGQPDVKYCVVLDGYLIQWLSFPS